MFSWLARTDPADVARVESKTVISTTRKSDTIPTPSEGVVGTLGYWTSPDDMDKAFHDRFPRSMKGIGHKKQLGIGLDIIYNIGLQGEHIGIGADISRQL